MQNEVNTNNGSAPAAGGDAAIVVEDGRREPFLWIDTAVLRRYKQIGPTGFAVYCALASYADNHRREAWPSYQTMADMLGISRQAVIVAMPKLLELGLVERRQRTDEDGDPTSNLYRLLPVQGGGKASVTTQATQHNYGSKASVTRGSKPSVTRGSKPSVTRTLPTEQDHLTPPATTTIVVGAGGGKEPARKVDGPLIVAGEPVPDEKVADIAETFRKLNSGLDRAWLAPLLRELPDGISNDQVRRIVKASHAELKRRLALPADNRHYVVHPVSFATKVWRSEVAKACAGGPA